MENKEFNISKPVSAFIVLVVAFLVIGYYVVNLLDIETEGTTAEEALLPNIVPSQEDGTAADTNFNAVRYPEDWTLEAISGGYRFTLDSEEDSQPQISIYVDGRSLVQILADVGQTEAAEIDNPYGTDDAAENGRRYSTSTPSQDGQPSITTDNILYPLPDRRTLRGELSAPSNNINDHRETFELMMNSTDPVVLEVVELPPRDSVEVPELTQVADDTGTVITIQYPDGWLVSQNAGNGVAGILAQQAGDVPTNLEMYILSPSLTAQGVLGLQQVIDDTPEGILNTLIGPGDASQIMLPTTSLTIGDYEGAYIVLRGVSEGSVAEIGILNYAEGLYLSYILSTSTENLSTAQAATGAMIQSLEYTAPTSIAASEVELASLDGGEPLPLTESIYSDGADITLSYPEAWQALATPESPSVNLSDRETNSQVQIFVIPAQDFAAQFQMDPSLISTTTALEAIVASVPAENVVRGIQPHTIGDYSGDNVILLFPPDPGLLDQLMVEVGILGLPNDQYLLYQTFGAVEGFADLQATVNEIVLSIELGDTAAEDASSDGEDTDAGNDPVEDDATDNDSEVESDNSSSEDESAETDETTDDSSDSSDADDESAEDSSE